MSYWISCNSCFASPGPDRHLAVTNCGHIICNVCFQRGQQGLCLICKATCQIYPLSDKSSSVQDFFLDINKFAAKSFLQIIKVLEFQAMHRKIRLTQCQQKIERMKEAELKMQQEMQKMSKTISEQTAYISKLETTVQHQRITSQSSGNLYSGSLLRQGSPVTKIPYCSPVSMSRSQSTVSLAESIDMDSRGRSYKPDVLSRICIRQSPQGGCIGGVPHRAESQSSMDSHSRAFSGTVSREFSSGLQEPVMRPSPNVVYRRESPWRTPVFKLPSVYQYPSVSSLRPLP